MKYLLIILSLTAGIAAHCQTNLTPNSKMEMGQNPKTWSVEELSSMLSIPIEEAEKVNQILQDANKTKMTARAEKKEHMQGQKSQNEAEIEKMQLARFAEMRARIDQEEKTYRSLRTVLSPSQIKKLEQAKRQEIREQHSTREKSEK